MKTAAQEQIPFIETPWPGVYANSVHVHYDGFAIQIDWRLLRPDENEARKIAAQMSVSRVTVSAALADHLVKVLQDILGRIAAQGLSTLPAPGTSQ